MSLQKPTRQHGNELLNSVGDGQFQKFMSTLRPVELDAAAIVVAANEACTDVIFPVTGVLSLLSVLDDGARVGSAIVGNEGFAPLAPFHGAHRTPEQVEVLVPGTFLRLSTPLFRQAVVAFPELGGRLHLFSQHLFSSLARMSGCDRRHGVKERCARLLLNTHDRVIDDELALTHERLATCLGVRRASVTVAADALRQSGAIEYRRGIVRVVNRPALLAACCGCYVAMRETADQLLRRVPIA